MKKNVLLASLLVFALLTGCGQKTADEVPENPLQLDTLAVELSREGQSTQQLMTAVQELPDLLTAYFADAGVEVGTVTVTVGASADTAQSLAAGNIDLAFLPAESFLLYGGNALPLLADGISAVLCAGDADYGKQLKTRAGKSLTWDELQNAKWGVISASADCLDLWLADNYEGNRLSELDQVTEYEDTESLLANAEEMDILVLPTQMADGLEVLAETDTLYTTLAAASPDREDLASAQFQTALDEVLSCIAAEEPERMTAFGAERFATVTDQQLDATRRWLTINGELS